MAYLIKELRNSTGMTQKAFSDMYGIPLSTLRKWEQGEASPAPYVIDFLTRFISEYNGALKKIKGPDGCVYFYNENKHTVIDAKGNEIIIQEDLVGIREQNLILYLEELFDSFYGIQDKFNRDCRFDREEDINENVSVKNEFSQKIGRLIHSKAYLDVCEEVYGYRTCMFGMLDKEQLEYLLNDLSVAENETVLDLGCGNGSVLGLIADRYQCSGIGVDLLERELIGCDDGRIDYICGDIDELTLNEFESDILLAVDSLYFSKNLDRLVSNIMSSGNRAVYLYYSQYIFDDNNADNIDRGILHADNTELARILQAQGVSYRAIDYSDNEQQLYVHLIASLQQHRADFEKEGNLDLCEQKLGESSMGLELYNKGLASRYLYLPEMGRNNIPE